MRYIKTMIMALATLAIPAQTLMAVTDKEMEEARAYTAKSYLRYVNNGSGYLDEINVKTMAELNSKLKAKEKENIAAFNAVKVPQDYAAWDKKQLVEYWAATFFTSPGLDPNGKAARQRVRKYIEGMTVTSPSAAESKPAETPAQTAVTPEAASQNTDIPEDGQLPPEEVTPQDQENILADQNDIEKAAEESRENHSQEQNRTWVYVLVLAILIGVVIWLVIYAANLMKRQPDGRRDDDEDTSAADSELREQTRKAIAAKNQELEQMRRALEEAEGRAAALAAELEAERRAGRRIEPEPKIEHRAETKPAPRQQLLKVIYLGRANKRGIFVRADRRITEGSTIYRLDTNDGLVGTFHVVDEPEVVELALTDPVEFLANGCTGEDLQDTAGVTRITTQSAGTAIFENGYWKVLRKSRISYE